MFMLFSTLSVTLGLSLLVNAALWGLSLKSTQDEEKLSPFECGFSPFEDSRQSFSIQFFLISLIFLIFDIELVILYPMIATALKTSSWVGMSIFNSVLLLLTAGYVAEWATGQLEWFE